MTFDELKKNWQSQQSRQVLNIDSDMLLKEVRRNKDHFQSMVFWRDIREIGVALFLAGWIGYDFLETKDWLMLPLGLAALFIAVFMIVDRIIQKRKKPLRTDTLIDCIDSSLIQIKHQIRLLRGVFWWYLLPILIGAAFVTVPMAWMWRNDSSLFWPHVLKSTAIWTVLSWGVYKLNQYAVRKFLQPRRQELEDLVSSVKDEQGGK